MRTVGEIRHERGLKVDQNKDSSYKVTNTYFCSFAGGGGGVVFGVDASVRW